MNSSYSDKIVMIFNQKCAHCFKSKKLNCKTRRGKVSVKVKEKMCFLRVINNELGHDIAHPAITCSKLTIETLEKGVKYVQS